MQENDKKKNGYAQQLNPIRKYPTEVHQFQNSAIHMEIANFSGVTVDVPFTFTPSEEPPHPAWVAPGQWEYTYFSIHLLIFLVSLIGNSLAILSLMSSASQFYVWFFNLVSSDLLKTCICMPYTLYLFWNYKIYRKYAHALVSPPFCTVEGVIYMVTMLVSLLSNMAIAVDRVIAISAPIFYANLQKQIKSPVLFAGTWVLCISIAILPTVKPDGYVYKAFLPNCSLELHNLLHKYIDNGDTVRFLVGTLYCLLFGLPILIVCISCGIVTMKLFKKTAIPSEDIKQRKGGDSEKKSRVMSNRESLKSNEYHSLDDSRLTRLSMDQSIDPNRSIDRRSVIVVEEMGESKIEKSSVVCDKMEMLHRPETRKMKKQGSLLRRQKLQKKAGLTMTLVALTFFLCHVCQFTYWAFYDIYVYASCSGGKYGSKNWSYGKCVTFQTAIITMVYMNAPLNVFIYYYRCSYLRQRMSEFFNILSNFVCFPCHYVRKLFF
ncbi:hypothetical protein ACHWQZ_G008025 [Mnemiopsis leidyi]